MSVVAQESAPEVVVTAKPAGTRVNPIWPSLSIPAIVWQLMFFLLPIYVVLSLAFGDLDPIFRTSIPIWNPLNWKFEQAQFVFDNVFGGFYMDPLIRTFLFVGIATTLCLVIAFPVAYYTARYAGKRRGILLFLLLAPFWISYMMRMLAWVNLLQNDGLVNSIITLGGLLGPVDWLSGRPYTVIGGLVYGYVPYMILPLYASLDRIAPNLLEAARDLGASKFDVFRRVILPMSIPGIAAGSLLVTLPMLGDYFTNDMLSGSPQTSMLGNLINTSISTPGGAGKAAVLIILLLLLLVGPMIWYVRTTSKSEGLRT